MFEVLVDSIYPCLRYGSVYTIKHRIGHIAFGLSGCPQSKKGGKDHESIAGVSLKGGRRGFSPSTQACFPCYF